MLLYSIPRRKRLGPAGGNEYRRGRALRNPKEAKVGRRGDMDRRMKSIVGVVGKSLIVYA